MAGTVVNLNELTSKEKAHAYRDANHVLDVVGTGFRFATAGELRAKLDWEVLRFARACAVLDAEGMGLFRHAVIR